MSRCLELLYNDHQCSLSFLAVIVGQNTVEIKSYLQKLSGGCILIYSKCTNWHAFIWQLLCFFKVAFSVNENYIFLICVAEWIPSPQAQAHKKKYRVETLWIPQRQMWAQGSLIFPRQPHDWLLFNRVGENKVNQRRPFLISALTLWFMVPS